MNLNAFAPRGRRWRLAIALAGLLAAAAGAQTLPASPPGNAAPAARPRLVVAFLDSPPEMVVYSKGRHSGVLQYILEEAARRIDCDLEWRETPFGSSLSGLKDGTVDIVTNVRFRTAERERFARFSVNLGNIPSRIYFLQNSSDQRDIKSLSDFSGLRVGYRDGVYYFKEFEKLPNVDRRPFTDNDSMARSFSVHEVDVLVVNNKISTERSLKSVGVNASRYRYASLEMNKEIMGTYMMYSLKPELRGVFDRIDAELEKMLRDGVIASIYKSFDAVPPKPDGVTVRNR
ncbi:substrate-binding periplasmic protein [Delftia sp. PS-11]|uniref:substrate-binding periplasmic protein n=1 Tax=Delftia sp. PS-11 TaxID=2767222 RepID=UPI002455E310|nr:transporter substrate-binding domain-containing protein [Delftia sp. PS-11]KAJ8744945.1 transporter substrate-binding domain-containing protein [Delftia sp. PS-11]